MKNRKRAFIAVLSVFAISASGAALAACNTNKAHIDAPERLEAELGTYVIPEYEVVDKNGMILAGYNVTLKSVTDANGAPVDTIVGSAVTIDDAGVYSFVYSANSKKVKDVTVSIDFADRTAPTINYQDDLPKFLIKGNSYKIPSYTLSGDPDTSKCWAKVYHIAPDKTETEVKVESLRFKVTESEGHYAVRIHVEDAAGNPNDYEIIRAVDGPETVVENKVLYLDEKFGERQISCYQNHYTGGYVSKDTEGAQAYGDEGGAYKVSFDGVTPTQYNEGLLTMDVPALIDLTEYEEIYLYVYNSSDNDIIMGSQWWNDTKVEKGKWTRLSWNTREWGNNMSGNNTKPISPLDISGMTIRFIFDYGQKVIPNGDFYLSAMYATPKVESRIEVGENVNISSGKHYINDVLALGATDIVGKTVDYYKVDGEIITGDSFTITKTSHKIEVVYVDGELTADNMTWATPELNPVGGDVKTQYMGNSDYWVMSHDVYGVESGWHHFGVYVGGKDQLLGFELVNNTGKLCGYGGNWKWGDGIQLTPLQMWILQSATETNPVKVTYVRRGNEIRVFLDEHFVGAVDFSAFNIAGNNFGFGARATGNNLPSAAGIKNFSAVAGEKKTNLHFEGFAAQLTVDGVKIDEKFYMGDEYTLTAGEAPEGKLFAYFKVNGERIEGNRFRLPSKNTVVETVYTDAVKVVLGEGIETEDGVKGEVTVPADTCIILVYKGEVPSGKYFIGFTVDGENIIGNEVYVTGAHEIGVLFADKIDTGSEKLNDLSGDVIYALEDDGETEKWKPASVEASDKKYTGSDGAVDENDVLKIVTGGEENSFAVNSSLVDNLDAYREFYFYVYTEKSGLMAGGWWCNDTNLVAGEWTKVTFARTDNNKPGTIVGNGEAKVWEEGISKFAYRIFKAPAGTEVYVTALYGVPYADVEVTTKDGVTVSDPANGKTYKEGETVTLYAEQEHENKVFAYFTANGEPVEGNTYTLTGAVEFGAVYEEFSTITLAEGIETADGKTGTFKVARDLPVYLKLTDKTKYFLAFSVDGEEIAGNSFTPTEGKTYSVTVTVENRTANDNAQTNSATKAETVGDVTAKLAYTHNISYNGEDGAVTEDGALRIAEISSNEFAVRASVKVGDKDLTNFKEVYFYIYTQADGVKAGTWWCNDTAAVKGQWTKVTVYADPNKNDNGHYNADGVSGKLFAAGSFGTNFVYRIMGGEGKTVYVTSLYGVPYRDATVKTDENVTVSAPANGTQYKEGETVTLTAKEAPEGQAFAYFTANGKEIEGATYTLTHEEVTFGAVYSEISTITLGTGVTAEDAENGMLVVGRGATVHLVFDGEVPSGKYFSGFEVDGAAIEGDSFKAVNANHSVVAVFAEKEDTGNVKLNEISTVATDGLSYHPTQAAWKPDKIEFVTDVKFTGNDAAVDESGSLKVVLSGGEQAFALNKTLVDSLDVYKEIYFYAYTEDAGVKAGGWWCNDTDLVAGEWTKIKFARTDKDAPQNISEKSVWAENSIDKFVYRINGAKTGSVVYFTAVYGVMYDEVSVTVEESLTGYITVEGTFREGQTITLSHEGAPEGQAFAYFTVNGEKIEGNTYKLGTEGVVIGAEFTDISTVTFTGGATAGDAENGKLITGRGATVVLSVGEAPEGKIFNYFKVDGERIPNDRFTTSDATHTVEAVYADSADELVWITDTEAAENEMVTPLNFKLSGEEFTFEGLSVGDATHWAFETEVYGFGKLGEEWYSIEFFTGTGASLSLRVHSAGNVQILKSDSANPDGTKVKDLDKFVVDACKAATEAAPVTFRAMRDGNTYYLLMNGSLLYKMDYTFVSDDNKFGVGAMSCGWLKGAPTFKKYSFRIGAADVDALTDVEITAEDVTLDRTEFKLGDTVALTAAAAPEGQKFSHFELDNKKIDGDSFVAERVSHSVKAVYSDISTLTLTNGVTTVDGQTEYARGATVTLAVTAPDGKIIDYFTVDGNRIVGNKFKVEEAVVTVGAVFVDNASQMTWTDGSGYTDYETLMGEDAAEWKERNFDGEVYGSSEYWAVSVNVKHTTEWNSFEFILGSKQSLRVRFHNANYFGVILIVNGNETVPDGYGEFLHAYPNKNENIVQKLVSENGAKITCIRTGDTLRLYADDLLFFTTNYAFDHTGDWFGVGYVNAESATKPAMTDTEFLTLPEKVEAFEKSLRNLPTATQKSEAQINNVSSVTKTSDSNEFASEYITEGIPTGLVDVNVKEKGVLKVTATGGSDIAFRANWTYDCDPNKFSEIYFWVYIKSDTDEALNSVAGGSYWKDGGLINSTNKWVKISFDSELISQLVLSAGNEAKTLNQFVFRIYSQTWLSGYSDITGKTMYVTALYGVPKSVDPLVNNKATNYSVVSGNDELTAILNNHFFPDAE